MLYIRFKYVLIVLKKNILNNGICDIKNVF